MHITKKNLLSLLKQNLNEMAMDFDSADRPHPDITGALSTGETPLKKVPLPSTGREPNNNFQELLASERYREVIRNVRRYTGIQDTFNSNPNHRLMMMMFDAHNKIIRIEKDHKEDLIRLAVEVVCKDMGINEGDLNFKVKLVDGSEINTDKFNRDQPNEENPEEVEPGNEEDDEPQQVDNQDHSTEEQLLVSLERLNLERAKQRLLNAITQGASKRGHYMYHAVEDELRQITGSDELINLYGIMMSINDTNYWQMGNNTISNLQSSVAGRVDVHIPSVENDEEEGGEGGDEEEGGNEGGDGFVTIPDNFNPDAPTITVIGVNFPVLLHELIKGVLKVFKAHGQSDPSKKNEKELYKQVAKHENTLEKEVWDLRLGPAIWARLRESFPDEVLEENNKDLQNYLFMNIFSLSAKKFLVFMKEVISGSDKGKRLVSTMVESIKQMFRDEDYQSAIGSFNDDLDDITDETDNEDLGDFLGGLGISLSGGSEDEEEDDFLKSLGLDDDDDD
jgi:hypothetical protein